MAGTISGQMIRELQPRTRVFLCALDWWTCVDAKPFFDEPGDHAGELETSVMQHVAPTLVLPLSEAGDGSQKRASHRGAARGLGVGPTPVDTRSKDTGTGNPAAASPEKGARFVSAVTARIASFLAELAATDPATLYD